jgi:hypothetical protein
MEREEGTPGYNPYFIIDIDERSFLECFVNSGEKLLMLSWKSYDHVFQSALIKMPSAAHGTAISEFSRIVNDWLHEVKDTYVMHSTATSVRGSSKTKVADFSWTPYDLPAGRSRKWPTVVGEVAIWQTRASLQEAMKFWLDEPESKVQVAISITASKRKILVERWVRRPNMATSPDQWIEISREPRKDHPRISGHLGINFSDVVLRDKRPGETDFIMTPAAMDDFARYVWRAWED